MIDERTFEPMIRFEMSTKQRLDPFLQFGVTCANLIEVDRPLTFVVDLQGSDKQLAFAHSKAPGQDSETSPNSMRRRRRYRANFLEIFPTKSGSHFFDQRLANRTGRSKASQKSSTGASRFRSLGPFQESVDICPEQLPLLAFGVGDLS